jgi:ATP adenylyltransferase
MDNLWAPWRMAYIEGEPEPGCLFCRTLEAPEKDVENFVLWRPKGALVMLNKFPYNSGHLMVAPMRHTGDLTDLAAAEIGDVMAALQRSIALLKEVMRPDGFNVGANLGRPAGAGIPDHVHFHAVPRWSGDTSFMPVLAETKVINEHLEATAAKLRAALAAGQ